MVAIDTGNLYITSGSVSGNTITGGTTVQIQTTKLDYNYNNALQKVPIPVSKGNRTTTTAYGRTIDIKRIDEAISVQGFLIEETGSRAIDKRNNLITLGKTGGGLTVVLGQGNYQTLWKAGTSPYGAFIQKMMITETAGQVGIAYTGDTPPESSLAIQMTLVRGKDM